MQLNGRMVMSLHLLMGGMTKRFHLAFQLGGIGVATENVMLRRILRLSLCLVRKSGRQIDYQCLPYGGNAE